MSDTQSSRAAIARPPLAASPAPSRMAGSRLTDSPVFLRLVTGIALLVAWEIAARAVGASHVARPLGIVQVFPQVVADPAFLRGAFATLSAVLQGLLIAVVGGTFIGLAMGRVRPVDWGLRLYVSAFFTMPIIAIVPLIILWLGNTSQARLGTIVFAAIFSVIVSARDGARSVPQEFLDVARVYRARAWNVWLGVTLPVALPYLLAGVRLACGRALIGALVAEFLLSIDGLGFFIMVSSRTYQNDAAFVAVALLAATGLGVDALINLLIRRLTPWYRRGGH